MATEKSDSLKAKPFKRVLNEIGKMNDSIFLICSF